MTPCEWCGAALPRQRGGTLAKRYCGEACRMAIHRAARRFGLMMLETGIITVDTLRNHPACQKRIIPPSRREVESYLASTAAAAPTGSPTPATSSSGAAPRDDA